MDITLERVLSFIPRKPDGKFVHGAKKIFAESIGLNHPQIISDWMAGRNSSYRNYLYAVSAKYNVSVEWLRGETDDPRIEKALTTEGERLPAGYELLTEDERATIDALIRQLVQGREGNGTD